MFRELTSCPDPVVGLLARPCSSAGVHDVCTFRIQLHAVACKPNIHLHRDSLGSLWPWAGVGHRGSRGIRTTAHNARIEVGVRGGRPGGSEGIGRPPVGPVQDLLVRSPTTHQQIHQQISVILAIMVSSKKLTNKFTNISALFSTPIRMMVNHGEEVTNKLYLERVCW